MDRGYDNNSNLGNSGRSFANVPPPSNINARHSYEKADEVYAKMMSSQGSNNFKKRRFQAEDDYFDQDDPEEFSLTRNQNDQDDNDDEEDPLDAFMKDLAQSEKKNPTKQSLSKPQTQVQEEQPSKKKNKGVRHDIEEEDAEEAYYSFMAANPTAGSGTFAAGSDAEDDEGVDGSQDQYEYDAEGNPIGIIKKMIDPLPMVYHSEIDYAKFEKNFYEEHPDIKSLSSSELYSLRQKLGIKVSGPSPPKPVTSFAHFGFDEQLLKTIRKLEYAQPTAIQAQAIPVALSGRDLIGIAKTGSGKTAAFIWPLIVHIMDQPELKEGDGPIGIILAPTRELSQQISTEAKRFAKPYGIRVVCAYGGGSKWEQSQDIQAGAEIIVATPGRMIDFVKMKATNFLRVTFLVLDEADRMFDMGFEPQVRSICNHIRPDRQCLMFSATFKKRIEKLARDVLNDPVRIIQGDNAGEANELITQEVHIFRSGTTEKWDWLTSHLVEYTSTGSVIIFVGKKANAQELGKNLEEKTNFQPLLLHGDMNQFDRNKVITSFKKQESRLLIATDVASRGLDISHVRVVINFDIAKDIDTHTHRIGRTGRAGQTGLAITLVTEADKELVGHLVRNLESANQEVPDVLMKLAMQSTWFKKSRFQSGRSAGKNHRGFQPRNRMGLGASNSGVATPNSNNSSTNKSACFTKTNFVPSAPSTSFVDTSSLSSSSSASKPQASALKMHFQSKFRSQFTPAISTPPTTAQQQTSLQRQKQEEQPRKKSRWDS